MRISKKILKQKHNIKQFFKILIFVSYIFTIIYIIYFLFVLRYLVINIQQHFENFNIENLNFLKSLNQLFLFILIIYLTIFFFIEIIFSPDLNKISYENTLILSIISILLGFSGFNFIKFGIYCYFCSFILIIIYGIYQFKLFSLQIKK